MSRPRRTTATRRIGPEGRRIPARREKTRRRLRQQLTGRTGPRCSEALTGKINTGAHTNLNRPRAASRRTARFVILCEDGITAMLAKAGADHERSSARRRRRLPARQLS